MYPFKLIQFSKLHLFLLKVYIQGLGKQFLYKLFEYDL
jgi:hypothetical protein